MIDITTRIEEQLQYNLIAYPLVTLVQMKSWPIFMNICFLLRFAFVRWLDTFYEEQMLMIMTDTFINYVVPKPTSEFDSLFLS